MLVIWKRYDFSVPFGRVPKSCRMTGGGTWSLPLKNLLAHGTGSWPAATGRARTRGSIRVRVFMVRQAPPVPQPADRAGPQTGSVGRAKWIEGVLGNSAGRTRPEPTVPPVPIRPPTVTAGSRMLV